MPAGQIIPFMINKMFCSHTPAGGRTGRVGGSYLQAAAAVAAAYW